jgi:hypothetical protein
LSNLTQLSRQNFASENKPLFGYITKGGYNAASLDERGSLQKLRGRNQFEAKVSENRTLRAAGMKKQPLLRLFP